MRFIKLALLAALATTVWAAQIPRPAPDLTVPLPNGKLAKVSDYRGKVLVLMFMLTTCPHCQHTTLLLEGMYPELKPKGFDVLQVALNQNPDIPSFVSQYKDPFAIGTGDVLQAVDYIQWPHDKRPLVPFLVFIDRKGTIRAQYTGVDETFFDNNAEQHIRTEIDKLLNEGGTAKATRKHAS
jgi:peroxiredoxin